MTPRGRVVTVLLGGVIFCSCGDATVPPSSSGTAETDRAEPASLETSSAKDEAPIISTASAVTGPTADLPAYGEPPSDWARAEPIVILGREEYACTAALLGGWIRITCPDIERATPVSGHRATQTRIETTGRGTSLTTPYVRGTDLAVAFDRSATAPQNGRARARFIVNVRWLGQDRPQRPVLINDEESKGIVVGRDF